MSRREQSKGGCVFCGKEMTNTGITNHLKACSKRRDAIREAESKNGGTAERLYHLQVQPAWPSPHWLHLEMKGSARLSDLDRYLRAIWLECCGHMSQFSIGGWRGEEISMRRRIEEVFALGDELTHIYDFGTESVTLVKALYVREGLPLSKHPIYLLARNNMPKSVCAECGEPAQWLCIECLMERQEWTTFCGKHAEEHPHDDYGEPIQLVNSPRMGLCGYEGPANPPY